MAGFELTGIEEMISQLDVTVDKVNRGVNKALRESAEPVKVAIRKNTHRSDGRRHKWEFVHAQDDVWISGVSNANDEKYVRVTYKNVSWRMYFVEFGTSKQKPQGVVQKSITQSKEQVRQKQVEVLRGVMRQL